MMPILRRFAAIIAALLLLASYAPPACSQAKTTISGWVRVGTDYVYNDRFRESFYQAKVQFNVKVSGDLEAQIDVRGESDTHTMELREAILSADLGKAKGLDFGHGKKRFGLEFQKSKEHLLTAERTLIYRRLEPFGFVGRDVNFRYYRNARPADRRTGISFNLGYSEDHNTTLIGHWTRLRTLGSFALGASGLLQLDKIDGGSQTVWGFGAELLRDADAHHVEIETIIGQDPFQSEFEKRLGGENVYFFGGKFLYGHRFKTSRRLLKAFEPVIVGSVWTPNIDAFELNTLELLAGMNFYLAPELRIALNGDLLLTRASTISNERSSAGSNVILQAQLTW
ncbi:MAG: hypothetical protein ACREOI_23920 [bacterium]